MTRSSAGLVVLVSLLGVAGSVGTVSAFPPHFNLVAENPAGMPDVAAAMASFVVMFPTPPAPPTVTLDFTNAHGAKLGVPQGDPSLSVSCVPGAYTVTAPVVSIGAAFGARFTVVGGGFVVGACPEPVVVKNGAVVLGTMTVGAYDLDGTGGMALSDLSLWASMYFTGSCSHWGDYNGDGIITLADLSLWAAAYFSGNDVQSAPSLCLVP
jgi:hypothetical protein